MGDGDKRRTFEATLRGAFATLVNQRLPAAARGRGWPVAAPDGFERVLLDHALGAPWETALPCPSIATATPFDLMVAIEMGERLIDGAACIVRLNRRSLAMRAARARLCARAPEPDPCQQAVRALIARARAAQPRPARRGRA